MAEDSYVWVSSSFLSLPKILQLSSCLLSFSEFLRASPNLSEACSFWFVKCTSTVCPKGTTINTRERDVYKIRYSLLSGGYNVEYYPPNIKPFDCQIEAANFWIPWKNKLNKKNSGKDAGDSWADSWGRLKCNYCLMDGNHAYSPHCFRLQESLLKRRHLWDAAWGIFINISIG